MSPESTGRSWDPPAGECLDSAVRTSRQLERLRGLLAAIHGPNAFYTGKLDAAGIRAEDVRTLDDLARLPLTTKQELVADQQAHPPWGTALTEPVDHYTRYCQTSSTTGRPIRWIDTNENWQWILECWKAVFRAAHVGDADRIFFPFSFGPFLGFWSAFEAGAQIGAHVVPGGGMSSQMRLSLVERIGISVICCTPTYALRLAEVAAEGGSGIEEPIAGGQVRVIIVAGEPGGSIPGTRARIERAWGARVIDHHGLTEVGPVSFECHERPGGLHLNESEFICELVDADGRPVADGEQGELVVTNLGRTASPVIRYRTGDVAVRRSGTCVCDRTFGWLEGGILSRSDEMVAVRGVNVYPGAIEAAIRRVPEVTEFRSTIERHGALRALLVEVETTVTGDATRPVVDAVARELREALGLTVPVEAVPDGTLPRAEMKSRRFLVEV